MCPITPFAPTAANSILSTTTILNALSAGNVTVQTNNDIYSGSGIITVASSIDSSAYTNSLSFNAYGAIVFNADVIVGGDLNLTTTTVTVTQAASTKIIVPGTLTLSTGVSGNYQNVTLNNANNDFATVAVTQANNVSLTDVNSLILGAMGSAGNAGTLQVVTGGDITQSGALNVAGASNFNANNGANDVTLSGSNQFLGAISATGNNVSFAANNNTFILGNITASALNLNTLTTTSTLSQSTGTSLIVSGVTTISGISTGANALTQANQLNGLVNVSLTGTSSGLTLTNAGNLQLGSVVVSSLTLNTNPNSNNGNITQTGTINSGSGASNATNLTVTAGTGTVTLGSNNNFNQITINSSGNATLVDINALTLLGVSATGDVSITANNVATSNGSLVMSGNLNVGTNALTLTSNSTNTTYAGTSSISLASGTLTAGTLNLNPHPVMFLVVP